MERTILKGATGLNNKVSAERLSYDQRTGITELAAAVNVDIDDSYAISRRLGITQLSDKVYHSLFCDGGDCFIVEDRTDDAAIMKVATDYSLTGVRSSLTKGARISFWQVGDKTFYSSLYQNGVIESGVSSPWPTQDHVGVDTTRNFSAAPPGKHIAVFLGRMWIVVGSVIWVSEPYAFGKFDVSRRFFQFGDNVVMIKPVENGVWVSTSREIGFIGRAETFEAMSYVKKASFPAHEYSANIALIDLSSTNLQIPGLSAIWSSDQGICIGTENGQLVIPTERDLIYSTGSSGATVVKDKVLINTVY